ncbi:MAG: COQ9 family protein [Pikeienuella sp.]
METTSKPKTESDHIADARAKLLAAALPHVAFDGWTRDTFEAAITDSGLDDGLARSAAPRGGIDLAIAFHRAGDAAMVAALDAEDLSAMRFSERIEYAVRKRIEIAGLDREAVRRGVTLFALPINAAEGAKLVWGTADKIWTTLGDSSTDYNWYSKRTILSGVYSATLLYWLGDESEGAEATWAFLTRRIAGVMQFEKVKAQVRDNKLASALLAGPKMLLSGIKAPGSGGTGTPVGLPGRKG